MSQCAATDEIAAEGFIMVAVEQVRNIGTGCDVSRQSVTPVQVENTIARNPSYMDRSRR